jgi:hypothetical protein
MFLEFGHLEVEVVGLPQQEEMQLNQHQGILV